MDIENSIIKGFFRSFPYLFGSGIVCVIAATAREYAKKEGYISTLVTGFFLCALFAFSISDKMGDPPCLEWEGNTCVEYDGEGYTPTKNEKIEEFAFFMALFFTPVFIGAKSRRSLSEIINKQEN